MEMGKLALTQKKQFVWDDMRSWFLISLISDNGVDMTRYLIDDTRTR